MRFFDTLADHGYYGLDLTTQSGILRFFLMSLLFAWCFVFFRWTLRRLLGRKRPRWFTWRRAKKMRQKARGEYLKELTGDLITDAFEEAELRGLWTRKEKNAAYERIGKCANYPDLIPKRLNIHPAAMKAHLGKLKESLQARRGIKEKKIKFPDVDKSSNVVSMKEKTPQQVRNSLSKLATKK